MRARACIWGEGVRDRPTDGPTTARENEEKWKENIWWLSIFPDTHVHTLQRTCAFIILIPITQETLSPDSAARSHLLAVSMFGTFQNNGLQTIPAPSLHPGRPRAVEKTRLRHKQYACCISRWICRLTIAKLKLSTRKQDDSTLGWT